MADFEHINMDTDRDGPMACSDYAQVVFRNVAETYPLDTDVEVVYTVTRYHSPSKRDWVGLYKVGWVSSKDHLQYCWAILPSDYQQGLEFEAKVKFAGKVLPKDDGEFYQLCYVTSAGQVRGASTPFQFKHPASEHFIETEDVDNDIMVIQSRTSALEAQLKTVTAQKLEIEKQKERSEKDMESYLNKLMDVEKALRVEKQEKKTIEEKLDATKAKMAELETQSKELKAENVTLAAKYDETFKENCELDEQRAALGASIKGLHSELDTSQGKCRTLEQEKSLYREHFTSSSDTLKENNLQLEALQCQHAQDQEEIVSLREAARQLQTELTDAKSSSSQDKEKLSDLRTQLQAVTEQREALTEVKTSLGAEIDSYIAANDKLSMDLQTSKSEAHDLQQRLDNSEQRIDEYKREREEMTLRIANLEVNVQEKAKENYEMSSTLSELQSKMSKQTTEEGGPLYAMQMAQTELQKRLKKSERERKNLDKDVAELTTRRLAWEQREKDLVREVEDLKERLLMGQEEYKEKYVECRKLQSILRSSGYMTSSQKSDFSRTSESGSETTQTPSLDTSEQMTQTAARAERAANTQTSVVNRNSRGGESAQEISSDDIEQQLSDLSAELDNRTSKKLKYKRLYQQEREKREREKQHYHEQLDTRDATIEQQREKLRELETRDVTIAQQREKLRELETATTRGDSGVVDEHQSETMVREVEEMKAKMMNLHCEIEAKDAIIQGQGNELLVKEATIQEQCDKLRELQREKDATIAEMRDKLDSTQRKETLSGKDDVARKSIERTVAEATNEFSDLNDAKNMDEPAIDSISPTIKRAPVRGGVEPPSPPGSNFATNAVKPVEGSTLVDDKSVTDYRGSRMQDPSSMCMDREPRPNDEKFYDAPETPSTKKYSVISECPECPICKRVFPIGTDLERHVNNCIDSAQAAPAPTKKCIMCDKTFPDGPEHQKDYEAHVQTHLNNQ